MDGDDKDGGGGGGEGKGDADVGDDHRVQTIAGRYTFLLERGTRPVLSKLARTHARSEVNCCGSPPDTK